MSDMGDVEITLDGKAETLKSTLRAAETVNAMGGFGEVYRRLAAMDLEAYISVVAAGLNRKRGDVSEAVWRAGIADIAEPVAEYVGLLTNGGRRRTQGEATGEA